MSQVSDAQFQDFGPDLTKSRLQQWRVIKCGRFDWLDI